MPASASAGPPPARRHRPHLDPSLVAEPLHPARNWAENTQEQNKLCRLAAQSSIATEQSSRAYLLFPWDKPRADNVTVSRIPIYLHTCHVRPPSQAPFPAVDPRSNPPLPYILSGHPGFAAFACDWTGLDAKIASGEPCSMGHARSLLLAPFDGCNERARSHRLLLPSFSVPAPWRRTGPSQVDDDLYRRTFSSEARSPGALARMRISRIFPISVRNLVDLCPARGSAVLSADHLPCAHTFVFLISVYIRSTFLAALRELPNFAVISLANTPLSCLHGP